MRAALDRVLAEDVKSPLALPPWDNASMDGYAVRAADVRGASAQAPATLPVSGTIAAGGDASVALAPGTAVRIMTGAPVPPGADSVVRVEDTDGGAERVRITADRDAGRNIRPRGEDIAAGAVAVGRGTALRPAHLGLLASVGRAEVSVHRRPRVAILSSGDELVDVDRFSEVLAGRRIVSSNEYTVEAAVRAGGALPISLGTAPDDPVEIRKRLSGIDCDLLITTGGVSVGAFDYTRRVLEELGGTLAFWRAKIRPGAPIGFGELRGTPWIGLPGNPVSALVTFELFARPVLRKMQGHKGWHRRPVRVVLGEPVSISAPLTHFLRAVVTPTPDGLQARLTGPQGSGLLTSMAAASALLVIPAGRGSIEAGESVDALMLHDDTGYSDALSL